MINCIIVEDEPLAAEVLRDYIIQVPFLKLKEICSDVLFALEILRREKIDLIFLDIHLPGLKGTDLLTTLTNPPKVIITTAYHEYALQGYELNVADYLLKPVEFSRFLQAVNKISGEPGRTSYKETVTIQTDKKKVIIPVEEIVYIESQKEYIKIRTITQDFITKYALTKMESELNPALFLRVHRSFVISLKKVKAYNGNEINLPEKTIPIGGNYRETVHMKLGTYF